MKRKHFRQPVYETRHAIINFDLPEQPMRGDIVEAVAERKFKPTGIYTLGASDRTRIDQIKIGIYPQVVSPIPAIIFDRGLSFKELEEVIKLQNRRDKGDQFTVEELSLLEKFEATGREWLKIYLPVIEPSQRVQVAIEGPISVFAIGGLEVVK